MATLLDMQTAIGDVLQDPGFTSVPLSSVNRYINTAISYYKYRKFWFNEKLAVITLNINSAVIPSIPADFLVELQPGGLVIAYSNMFYPLRKVPSEIYDRLNVSGVGRPNAYVYRNQGFELYWYPDQAYTLNFRYLKDYAAVALATDTNDFFNYAFDMILYNTMSRYYAELKQDSTMESYYSARADDEEKNVKKRSDSAVGTGRLTLKSNLLS